MKRRFTKTDFYVIVAIILFVAFSHTFCDLITNKTKIETDESGVDHLHVTYIHWFSKDTEFDVYARTNEDGNLEWMTKNGDEWMPAFYYEESP